MSLTCLCDSSIAPGPIADLKLNTTDVSLYASWKTEGNSSSFNVKLLLDGKVEEKEINVSEITFTGLKTAAKYKVTVYAFNGHLKGEPSVKCKFTSESPWYLSFFVYLELSQHCGPG